MCTDFIWQPEPRAAELIGELIERCVGQCAELAEFSLRLRTMTGTRLRDWIAFLEVPSAPELIEALRAAGFQSTSVGAVVVWTHAGGLFPPVVLGRTRFTKCVLRVESMIDFLAANQTLRAKERLGADSSQTRAACVATSENVEWWVVEQTGARDCPLNFERQSDAGSLQYWTERIRLRQRLGCSPKSAFDEATVLVREAGQSLGEDRACQLFFACEREYWQRRNRAAGIQKARQDQLGMGWANHDHHTYRSSRQYFTELMRFFESLGFVLRERFYAGRDSGWGAQVLEHPRTGIIIFADVDLSPDEVVCDFAHEPLPKRKELGTIGLWCELHGEAFLEAGMHHLECQFDFEAAREQLASAGIVTMKPFTDLPHLRQAFTVGETWPIHAQRLESLVAEGQISVTDAEQFRQHGAVGSHLEILERNDGYKGFNQKGINEIIQTTDPRWHK